MRRVRDAYMTPPKLAEAIVARAAAAFRLTPDMEFNIIEPGAGTGVFVRAARAQWPRSHIVAVDVDGRYRRACMKAGADDFVHGDYSRGAGGGWATLTIGNPPFGLAAEFIREALDGSAFTCFLMRAAFRAGVGRWAPGGLFDVNPPRETWPVVPRPSFTGGGTEHSEYEVFLFGNDRLDAIADRMPGRPPLLHEATVVSPVIWRAPVVKGGIMRVTP